MNKKNKNISLLLLIIFLFGSTINFSACSKKALQSKEPIRIALPFNEKIENIETNYYKCWLENRSDLQLSFDFIPLDYTEEYLRLLFSSRNSDIDAVFFNSDSGFPSQELIQKYGEKGYILPLERYIDAYPSNLKLFMTQFDSYDIRRVISDSSGHIYYMPCIDLSSVNRNNQTLWLNSSWLQKLKLSMPKTPDELIFVLESFRDNDPNNNGKRDEIPLVSSSETYNRQIHNFLINSFVYNDPSNSNMAVNNGKVFFAPITDQWRQAMIFCHQLLEKDLLPAQCMNFSNHQMSRIVNDPRDLVGGFTCGSITDVIMRSSPELLSQFVHITPLKGPQGSRFSTVCTSLPRPGGVITSACKKPEEVFQLMDLMVGEEASLIGRYGEQGVDWDFANAGDISLYGTPATIVVRNQVWNKIQNKYFLGMGPYINRDKYADGVTWRGFQADQEYLNTRAYSSYRKYEPSEYIKTIFFDKDTDLLTKIRSEIDTYTEKATSDFITGNLDIHSDEVWENYLLKYKELKIDYLTEAVQKSYTSSLKR